MNEQYPSGPRHRAETETNEIQNKRGLKLFAGIGGSAIVAATILGAAYFGGENSRHAHDEAPADKQKPVEQVVPSQSTETIAPSATPEVTHGPSPSALPEITSSPSPKPTEIAPTPSPSPSQAESVTYKTTTAGEGDSIDGIADELYPEKIHADAIKAIEAANPTKDPKDVYEWGKFRYPTEVDGIEANDLSQ